MLVLTDVQKVKLSVSPRSAAGNPALIDGAPKWSVSDDTIVALEVAEDGMGVDVVTTGKIGSVRINVDVDADLGDGVRNLTGVLDIEVKASEAVSIDINANTPEVK